MKTIRILVSISLLLITSIALTQTIIREGKVSGNWSVEYSPYLIQGDIYVPENHLLSVEAGVEILFQPRTSLKVQGQLLAIGNEVDSIIFTAENPEEGWAGILWLNMGVFEDNLYSKIEYCKLSHAKSEGRFPMNYGGAVCIINTNNVVVSHCLFENCEALNWGEAKAKGGAMAFINSDAKVSHCVFQNNTSVFGGALVFVSGSNPVINNCLFVNNEALEFGGAVEVMELSAPTFVNCTFADNYSEFAGGAIDLQSYVRVYMLNSILWNNQSGRVLDQVNAQSEYTGITFAYCNVEGGVDAIFPYPFTSKSVGNIDFQPEFFGYGDHPYSLATNSPCIDVGTTNSDFLPAGWDIPNDDLVGNFRVFNESVDMGCYEYVVIGPVPPEEERKEFLQLERDINMHVYPCPARTSVTFEYAVASDAYVSLLMYDMQGRMVADLLSKNQTEGIKKLEIDVQSLPKGTYIYKLNVGNQFKSGQILVVN